MRVKCLAQEHNTMTRPELEPGPLDPESIVLITTPLHLSFQCWWLKFFYCNFYCLSDLTMSMNDGKSLFFNNELVHQL